MNGSFVAPCASRMRGFIITIIMSLFGKAAIAGGENLPAQFTDAGGSKPFLQKLDGLNDNEEDLFLIGRSFFSIPWVIAPSATTARDGLGPLFNANTCNSCHVDNGTGETVGEDGQPRRALVFKLAQPTEHKNRDEHEINIGDPHYGRQVAINGIGGNVLPEATPTLEKQEKIFTFPDGTTQTLTRFIPKLTGLNYGEIDPKTVISPRQAPTLAGLGLVSQVDEKTIAEWADPEDKNQDGISGRINHVYDIGEQKMTFGKYGWKAGQPTVFQQTADAAAHDMGLTNILFPKELCMPNQTACLDAPRGRPSPAGDLDLPPLRLQAIAYYVQAHKAPQTENLSPAAAEGEKLFTAIGCTNCHRPELKTRTGEPFAPYSDYLLHDMGTELADGRPEFDARPEEWRTAPLWGLGQRVRVGGRFLHDARAASPLEAILWHDGEAETARDRFAALPAAERLKILTFLESL